MKKFKAFSLIVLFSSMSLGYVSHALAQATVKLTTEEKIEKVKNDLGLDKKQVTKLTAIYADQKKKIHEIQTSGLDKPSMVLKRREVWKSTDDQIEAMLTPEQKTKWPQEKADLKAMESHHPATGPKD